jgi:hypothetical protein
VTGRRVAWGSALLLLVGLGVFAWQAVTASRALLEARTDGEQVQQRVRAGDFEGANRALASLGGHTRRAAQATDGVLWDLGRHVPVVGRNIGAVQVAADVLDAATRDNAPVALELSRAVDQGRLRPRDGRIDLAEVERLTPSVRRAADSIDRASRRLSAIRVDELLFPFNDLVGDLQTQVDRARSAAVATADAFDLLPGMLGGSGARTYLLVIQNPAELRATGGLPGSLALLHADHGRLRMGWQGSPGDLGRFTEPVVPLARDAVRQYGPTPATDLRDANFNPDFPQFARIAKAMVEQRRGVRVDGVVSVDPLALAEMMRGTGPVDVGNGVVLDAANVVPALLNQTYQAFDTQLQQNDFFETVARRVFDAVMAGRGNQQLAVRGLGEAAGEHRIQVWSGHADEQSVLDGTAVAGALVGRSTTPHVGVYLNDTGAAKMGYYLQYRSTAAAVDCRQGGAQDLRTTLALTSTMPADFKTLSPWIIGTGRYAPQGSIAFNLRVYAPYGGEVTGLSVDGQPHSATADKHRGRQVALLPLTLRPGQTVTVTADLRTAEGQSGDGVLSFTPGMLPAPNGVRITSACR